MSPVKKPAEQLQQGKSASFPNIQYNFSSKNVRRKCFTTCVI